MKNVKHKNVSISKIPGCGCHSINGINKPSSKCRIQVKKRVRVCVPGKKCETKLVRIFKIVSCKTRKHKRS